MSGLPNVPPWILLLLTSSLAPGSSILNVTPTSNNHRITQVVLSDNGTNLVQNVESPDFGVGPAAISGTTPVLVKSVSISTGNQVSLNLTHFNTLGAAVENVSSHITAATGVGVYDNGVITNSKNNTQAYSDALAKTTLDTDLRNFSFYDTVVPALPKSATAGADMSLLFHKAVRMDDYFMVSERWGNSSFTVTALMENGQPYQGANILQLGGPPATPGFGDPFSRYDWNTGYSYAGEHFDQAFGLTVFSAEKFFEGTQITSGPIFGLRIDNDIEADVKIIGISANTFADNETNSRVIPEPSSFALVLLGSFLFLGFRKRTA